MHLQDVYEIFSQLNAIPRSSHHEEKVADYLCQYAQSLGLDYSRDAENCVVIRKPASRGYEEAEPIVLLNHMDMVAVGDGSRPFDPVNDVIEAYIENGWMKARGTSLGADNGIGLSMALAVLGDDSIVHPALEVLTTTNEEDGMTGAAHLSSDFIKGRKVINLDSEDFDTITVGAAGAYLQKATMPLRIESVPEDQVYFEISISGGLGGHSGVDINKGRINAIHEMCRFLSGIRHYLVSINGGNANASIPSSCTAIIGMDKGVSEFMPSFIESLESDLLKDYPNEPNLRMTIRQVETQQNIIYGSRVAGMVLDLPCGVIRMRDDMPNTVMTSNNIGMIRTEGDVITVSCHTRSFDDAEMVATAQDITKLFESYGAKVEVIMNTPGWQEKQGSDYLNLVGNTFHDVLGFVPRPVAMHFVLEAGYYVQKYPGIQIACIGPRIIEPHSVKERVEISTIYDIYRVLIELLKRLK